MIYAIGIENYKCIRSTRKLLKLDRFHVLVGPNASGKSTFLDAIDFVKDCLQDGPQKAVELRVPTFRDLTWMRRGGAIRITLWLDMGHILEVQNKGTVIYRGSDHPILQQWNGSPDL